MRGKGLVIGIELNKRGCAKEPADEAAALTVYRSYELGLLYYYAGVFNNVLEFTPPLVIREEQVKTAVQIIDQALSEIRREGKYRQTDRFRRMGMRQNRLLSKPRKEKYNGSKQDTII